MPGVYISYPFCAQKCSFCNFASSVSSAETRSRYQLALRNELHAHVWQWLPETLYFGGGTPSLMPLEFFHALIDALPRERLSELTIECAPGTLDRDHIQVWKRHGINRISLGVQSFVTAELRATGRRHTAETVHADLKLLRESGIDNINIDLIAGLPNQTPDSWEHSLDCIEYLHPPHVSVYIFEVDEDSRLGKEILMGGNRYAASRVPPDDLTADLYERAVTRLSKQGLKRYEISNFALEGWESRHNLKYWRLEPYVGFGLDAHSFDGRQRWSNPDTLDAYFEHGQSPVSVTDASEEHFFVGLRLMNGIQPTPHEWSRFAHPIDKWIEAGMLQRDGACLRLSDRGVLLSNEIFQEFIDA